MEISSRFSVALRKSNHLRNDPDKNCSICYCSAAIRFLQVETVVFPDREFTIPTDRMQLYEMK